MIEITVKSKNGIHARPASEIVTLCGAFEGEVYLIKNDTRYNAKSIMSIMQMGLLYGESFCASASGEGADALEKAIKDIIESIQE